MIYEIVYAFVKSPEGEFILRLVFYILVPLIFALRDWGLSARLKTQETNTSILVAFLTGKGVKTLFEKDRIIGFQSNDPELLERTKRNANSERILTDANGHSKINIGGGRWKTPD